MKIYIKSDSSYIKSEISYMGYEIYKGVDGYHILDPSGAISDSDIYETESEAKEAIREQGTNAEASKARKPETKNFDGEYHTYSLQGPAHIQDVSEGCDVEISTKDRNGVWVYTTTAKSKSKAESNIWHRIYVDYKDRIQKETESDKVGHSRIYFDPDDVVPL